MRGQLMEHPTGGAECARAVDQPDAAAQRRIELGDGRAALSGVGRERGRKHRSPDPREDEGNDRLTVTGLDDDAGRELASAEGLVEQGARGGAAAVASPLAATTPSTLLAARRYHELGLVDSRVLAWTFGAGAPATLLGALASRAAGGGVLVLLSELVLLTLGIRIVARRGDPHERSQNEVATWRLAAVAVTTGLAAGLLANAGGFLLAPLLVTVLHRPLKVAFGTSLAAATVLAIPGTAAHAALGHIV
jgi:Sulfite exporter TauE/SafE